MATYAKKRNNLSKRARLATLRQNDSSIFDEKQDNNDDTLSDIFPDIDIPKEQTIAKIKKEKTPRVVLPKDKNSRVSKKSNSTMKRIKPKPKQPLEKKQADPWEGLLDNIDSIPIELPKISLDEDSEDNEDEKVSVDCDNVQFNIDLNFDNISDEPTQKNDHHSTTLVQKFVTPQTKTYSQDRSYLIEDRIIDVKEELGESISKKYDFRKNQNDNDNDDSNRNYNDDDDDDDVINVNDLRTAGKLNQFQDIIDGLISNLTNLQLSSLLELLNNDHAKNLFNYIIKLVDCEKEIIRYVSSIVVFQVFLKNPSLINNHMNKLHLIWLGLKLQISTGQVARIYRDVIQKLIDIKYDIKFLQLLYDQGIITKKICLLQLDNDISGLVMDIILKFLDNTEEEFTQEELIKFKPKLNTCFDNINKENYNQNDLKFIKILVVLTTIYSLDSLSCLIDEEWIPIMISHMTCTTNKDTTNMTLGLLAILLNLVEWDILSNHYELINEQIHKIKEIKRERNESTQYIIIGYNSIILASLKINHSLKLTITNDELKTNLTEFNSELESSNKGLYSMVCSLINKL